MLLWYYIEGHWAKEERWEGILAPALWLCYPRPSGGSETLCKWCGIWSAPGRCLNRLCYSIAANLWMRPFLLAFISSFVNGDARSLHGWLSWGLVIKPKSSNNGLGTWWVFDILLFFIGDSWVALYFRFLSMCKSQKNVLLCRFYWTKDVTVPGIYKVFNKYCYWMDGYLRFVLSIVSSQAKNLWEATLTLFSFPFLKKF